MSYTSPPPIQRTVSPTATDDSNSGYRIGVMWVNTVTNQAYLAVSVAVGAAVWQLLVASLFVVTTIFPYDAAFILDNDSTPTLQTTGTGVLGGP